MRVTLKAVNDQLAELGAKTELAKGAGYFFFRGGEAEDWIDRTVRVPTIGSLTLEQWLNEYQRLKLLNQDIIKAGKHASPRPAGKENPSVPRSAAGERRTSDTGSQPPPASEERPDESARKQACDVKAQLLAELDQAYQNLMAAEEQEVRAARENRVSDFVSLNAAASRERGKFDRALLEIREHTKVHRCS